MSAADRLGSAGPHYFTRGRDYCCPYRGIRAGRTTYLPARRHCCVQSLLNDRGGTTIRVGDIIHRHYFLPAKSSCTIPLAHCCQGAEVIYFSGSVILLEDCRACYKSITACLGTLGNRLSRDSTINFDESIQALFIDSSAQLTHLFEHVRHELLAAKTRFHAHD